MMLNSRAVYLTAAAGLHAALLWGFTFGPPTFISDVGEQGEPVEVGLVEEAPASVEAAPEPLTPEPPPPEPVPPEPEPTPQPPPPPPDAMAEPVPSLEPPKPPRQPPPKPKTKPAARPSAPSAGARSTVDSPVGAPGAGAGIPGPNDNAHATWRNRVKPAYPPSARAAKQFGRVLIVVEVNALGQSTAARISSSSGFPALDQAALAAARESTYNPRKIAGIPLSDSITVPYSFRLDER